MAATVLVLLSVPTVWAQRGDAAAEPAAEAAPLLRPLALFEIRDLDEFIGKFETDLGTVLPMYTPGSLWKVITEASGANTLAGVDRESRLTFALYNPEAAGVPLGIVLTVSDVNTLLQGLETALTKGEVEGDLHVFYKETTSFDSEAYREATPEERQDVERFKKVEKGPLYVMVKDRLAMISRSRGIAESLGSMQRDLERGLTVSDWVKDCDVLGSLDMQEIMEVIQPKIDQMAMQGGQGMTGAASPEAMMNAMKAQVEAFQSLATSVEDVDLGVMLEEGGELIFRKSVTAVTGGTLAGLIANQGMHKPSLVKYAPENAAMVGWMGLDDWAPLTDFALSVSKSMAGGMEQELFDKMMEQSKAMLGNMGKEVVFAMYPGSAGGMGLLEVIQVTDSAKAAEGMAESMKLMAPFYANMGMGMNVKELAPEEYKGVTLQGFQMEFAGEEMPPEASMMMNQMYGGTPTAYAGVKGNNMLVAFGADSSRMMKEAIDAVEAGRSLGFDRTSAYKTATRKLPNDGEGIGLFVVSVSKFGDFIKSMVPPAAGPVMMPPLPDEVVYVYVGKEGDRLDAEMAVPLGNIVKGAMEGMMQMAMPAEGGGAAGTE